jgi:hypothetical protein
MGESTQHVQGGDAFGGAYGLGICRVAQGLILSLWKEIMRGR